MYLLHGLTHFLTGLFLEGRVIGEQELQSVQGKPLQSDSEQKSEWSHLVMTVTTVSIAGTNRRTNLYLMGQLGLAIKLLGDMESLDSCLRKEIFNSGLDTTKMVYVATLSQ